MRTSHPGRAPFWLCVALALPAVPARAQVLGAPAADPAAGPRPEARLDLIAASRSVLHAGAGLDVPVSRYARVEGVVAAGPRFGPGGPTFSARGDAVVRFVLDPLVQLANSPYGGAGVSVRRDGGRTRGDVVAVLGLQLRSRSGVAPAVELGLGGGARVGVVLRRVR